MIGMSEKILTRKRDRRNRRVWITLQAIGIAVIGGMIFHADHVRQKQLAMTLAPDWASFTLASKDSSVNLDERVKVYDSEGTPENITVNGERWDIVLVDHFPEIAGPDGSMKPTGIMATTDCTHKMINYIKARDPNTLRINLMHEIFHAGACLHGNTGTWWNSTDDEKHEGVYHLGQFMANFTQDNPIFMEWAMHSDSPYGRGWK